MTRGGHTWIAADEERAQWLADMVAQGYIPADLMTVEEMAGWVPDGSGVGGRAREIYQQRLDAGTSERDPRKLKHYPSGELVFRPGERL